LRDQGTTATTSSVQRYQFGKALFPLRLLSRNLVTYRKHNISDFFAKEILRKWGYNSATEAFV